MNTTEATLTSVQTRSEFLDTPEGKALFGSTNAIEWFERINRQELVESGVLFKLRGKWCRTRPGYDSKVLEISRRKTLNSITK